MSGTSCTVADAAAVAAVYGVHTAGDHDDDDCDGGGSEMDWEGESMMGPDRLMMTVPNYLSRNVRMM